VVKASFSKLKASQALSVNWNGISQYSYLKCSKCAFRHVKLINQESLKAVGDAINGLLM